MRIFSKLLQSANNVSALTEAGMIIYSIVPMRGAQLQK